MEIRFAGFSFAVHVHKSFFRLMRRDDPRLDRRNLFMFVQDVSVRVAPYVVRDLDSEQPAFKLDGTTDQIDAAVTCLSAISSNRRHWEPEKLVEDVVRHCAERLPWTGRILLDLRDEGRRNLVAAFASNECYDAWTLRIGSYVAQFGVDLGKRSVALHIGLVPRRDVLEVSIPPELGGVSAYRRMIRRLDRFDTLGPRYWRKALQAGTAQGADWALNFTAYRRRASAYRDGVSRDWGWSGRDTSTDFKTEYFSVFRHLRMHRACAIVREAILRSIEQMFAARGIRARVVTNQLPSAGEIEGTISRLSEGAISLKAAYEALRVP